MRPQRLVVGLIALAALWLVGLGIDRVVGAPTQPEHEMPTTPASTDASQASTNPVPLQNPAPILRSVIFSSRMADVDQLLQDWTKSPHGAGAGYFKYDRDVRLVVRYRNGIAVGVAALSLRDRPISITRGAELTRLVGIPPDDVNHLNGELHEIYYGDI